MLLHSVRLRSAQRGVSLVEALIAFLVLSFGMLAIARVQTDLRQNAGVARQRSEAVRVAQEEIESLRAFADRASFDAITSATPAGAASDYRITRRVDAVVDLHAKALQVEVGWTERSGTAQAVALNTLIAGTSPTFSGALALPQGARGARSARGALGRSARIPVEARNLGDGRSAFEPGGRSTILFVFDNASGTLIGRCDAVAQTAGAGPTNTRATTVRTASELAAATLGNCDKTRGRLLSGIVRFSSASPPDPAGGHDVPLATQVTLSGSAAAPPVCTAEPITTQAGDRYLAYFCAVYPPTDDAPPPSPALLPIGWTIGTGAADHRVCHYAAGTGWAHRNLLVVGGRERCPAAGAAAGAGAVAATANGNNGALDADLTTVQQQP